MLLQGEALAQPVPRAWMDEQWAKEAMETIGPDASVIKWQDQPNAQVCVEDLHRILVGNRPSDIPPMLQEGVPGAPAPTEGGYAAGDNVIVFFSLHTSIRAQALNMEFLVKHGDPPLLISVDTDFFHLVVSLSSQCNAAEAAGSAHLIKSLGRYLSFSVLRSEHYLELLVDTWGRKVYIWDGIEPSPGAATLPLNASAQQVADEVLPQLFPYSFFCLHLCVFVAGPARDVQVLCCYQQRHGTETWRQLPLF